MGTLKPLSIAYLVAAHTDFDQLLRLCEQLVFSGDVFIHIDKKVNDNTFQSVCEKFRQYNFAGSNQIIFIKDRIPVYWAGFSQVKLQRLFLKYTLEYQDKTYTRFVFLSGLCYPIKCPQYILKEFENNRTKEYVCAINLTNYNNKLQNVRYAGYHYLRDGNLKPTLLKKALITISDKLLWALRIRKSKRIKHNGKNEDIYFGGSWMGLTRECAEYIYGQLSESSDYSKYFKTSYASDELCIQTIIFNSRFKSNACLVDERSFTKPGALFLALSPLHHLQYIGLIKVYTENDYNELIKTDKIFVRKIISGKSNKLVNMLQSSFNKSDT